MCVIHHDKWLFHKCFIPPFESDYIAFLSVAGLMLDPTGTMWKLSKLAGPFRISIVCWCVFERECGWECVYKRVCTNGYFYVYVCVCMRGDLWVRRVQLMQLWLRYCSLLPQLCISTQGQHGIAKQTVTGVSYKRLPYPSPVYNAPQWSSPLRTSLQCQGRCRNDVVHEGKWLIAAFLDACGSLLFPVVPSLLRS